MYKAIEEAAWFPEGDFALEVSSPGVEEPLILNRQYVKNIGRTVEVILNDEAVFTGMMKEVTDKDILIEWTAGKGKKAMEIKRLLSHFRFLRLEFLQSYYQLFSNMFHLEYKRNYAALLFRFLLGGNLKMILHLAN